MSDDCVQCREWELCPFHPKAEPVPDTERSECVSDIPEVSWLSAHVVGGTGSFKGELKKPTDCGHYMRTYRDGVLVDEEPIECYQSIPLKPTR